MGTLIVMMPCSDRAQHIGSRAWSISAPPFPIPPPEFPAEKSLIVWKPPHRVQSNAVLMFEFYMPLHSTLTKTQSFLINMSTKQHQDTVKGYNRPSTGQGGSKAGMIFIIRYKRLIKNNVSCTVLRCNTMAYFLVGYYNVSKRVLS